MLFNPSLRNSERQAGEMREAAGQSLEGKLDDVVAATVMTYLDLGRARRSLETVRGSAESFLAAEQIIAERVRAGLELPIETTRARLNTARSNAEQVGLATQVSLLEARLRSLVGLPSAQTILTAPADIPLADPEETPERLISLAPRTQPRPPRARRGSRGQGIRRQERGGHALAAHQPRRPVRPLQPDQQL